MSEARSEMDGLASPASRLACSAKWQEWLDGLDAQAALDKLHDWEFWARPEQLPPPGDWRVWLLLAGRGFGKTRVGAEFCRREIAAGRARRVALVAPTAADARDVMVEGESGVVACFPDADRPLFEPTKRRLTWRNGAIATLYSADEPERLRGPQHDLAWCDELGSWRYPEAWDMLMFGLRLGIDPRVVATTTPRPTRLIRDLVAARTTVITRGATLANRANLAAAFIEQITRRYQGTRLGRQELSGELLEDSPGALWTHAMIEDHRTRTAPAEMARIVVAIDPAATSGEDADETGILVVAKDRGGHGYVLADMSGRYGPNEWARAALALYREWHADRVVAEINNGGEMVEATLRMIDPAVAYSPVRASRGKVTRAEPCAALYEQGRVHHVGAFPELEDQMCLAHGTLIETHRGQVPIEQVNASDLVMTRQGYREVRIATETGMSSVFFVIATTDGKELRCTQTHPIFDAGAGRFVPAWNVRPGMLLDASLRWASTAHPSRGADAGIIGCRAAITAMLRGFCCTERFGRHIGARSRRGFICTIWTKIREIISSPTYDFFLQPSTSPSTSPAGFGYLMAKPDRPTRGRFGSIASGSSSDACNAGNRAGRLMRTAGSSAMTPAAGVLLHGSGLPRNNVADAAHGLRPKTRGAFTAVQRVTVLHTAPEKVYNLEVDGEPEYYANGLLVHNCIFARDFDRQRAGFSPDRVDALVWGLTDLLVEPMAGEGIYEIYRQAAALAKTPEEREAA